MLLSFMIVARIIGKESYGELGIIRSTLNMFTLLAGMGLVHILTAHNLALQNMEGSTAAVYIEAPVPEPVRVALIDSGPAI